MLWGRNGVLRPQKLFSYVHPRFHTPAFAVVFVGFVSLLAIAPSLELISSMINFGALIAFTFVNLSVIAYFVFRQKRYKTGKEILSYIVMPLIGAALTGVLWSFLHVDALVFGLSWMGIGFLYLVFLTKGFRRRVSEFSMEETATDDAQNVEPMEPVGIVSPRGGGS